MGIVVVGSIVLALLIAVLPGFPHGPFPGSLVMSLLVVVFGFFFVTVASRIVGIIGTSSNPISGMTIATLMGTCVVFVLIGRTGEAYQPVALCVGALVCIAAANAGATSQDLKTGFLVGATPRRQQIGFIIGVLVSTLVIGGTLFLLDKTYAGGEAHGIGGPKLAAPQATLMATIIKGLLAQNLPWAPVLVGVFLAFMAQMAGAHALSWAVGAYLPLSTTFPIWIGGMMKALAEKVSGARNRRASSPRACSTPRVSWRAARWAACSSRSSPSRAIRFLHMEKPTLLEKLDLGETFYPVLKNGIAGDVLCALVFAGLCLLLVRNARKDLEA